MKTLVALVFLVVCDQVRSQCYVDSDIAIHWSQLPSNSPFQEDSNQCLANYTIFNEDHIDTESNFVTINIDKGVNCSRRDSTATTGTWTNETDGTVYDCSDNTGEVRCERGSGSVTLYTAFGCNGCGGSPWPNGVYTCCIEGDCISIRVYQIDDFKVLFPNSDDAVVENCSIIPPSDMTITPQQYTVKMNTSGVPPIRLVSNIDCTSNCGDITRGKSYYTLIDLTEERYQYSVPVSWSTDTSNTNHTYNCRAIFGNGIGGTFLSTTKTTSITASNAPSVSSDYEVINATAVRVRWSITGDVNGYVINITSSGLSTVTQQLTDGLAREFIYNGLLPERDYTVEVRGYYELLGLGDSITVRLKAGINSVNTSLVTVRNGLSTQEIQVNCYTFRVELNQITWIIDSVVITPGSSYQPVAGSELINSADQIYKHYITLTGSFSDGSVTSCSVTVNGVTRNESRVLQVASSPPTGLSATILSASSLYVNWTPLSGVTGYIIQYTPNEQFQLLSGEESSSGILEGLNRGIAYQISVHSYLDLPSGTSSEISVLFDVPLIIAFDAQPLTPTSVIISWITQSNSITDNYMVTYTRLCDNVGETMLIEDGTSNNTTIDSLYAGLQYSVSITPVNMVGTGMKRTDSVTLEESDSPTGAPSLQPPVVISSTAVRLSWGEVNCTERNGDIIGYSIQYNTEGGPQSAINVTGVTTVVITGLTQFSLYNISVAAINNNGIGPYSKAFTFYTTMTGTANIGAVIGSAFGITCIGVLVTFAVIAAILLIRKKLYGRRKHRLNIIDGNLTEISNRSSGEIVTYNRTSEYVDVKVSESIEKLYSSIDDTKTELATHEPEELYVNTSMTTSSFTHEFDHKIPVITPISVEDLGCYVFECHKNMNRKLKEELMSLCDGSDKMCGIGQSDENKLLNRFKNITVYDENRIVLINAGEKFINASYINGYNTPQKYIATQAPLPKTVVDFWHLVWQENVKTIVILTNLIEDKKTKCTQYWPDDKGSTQTIGDFMVTLLDEEVLRHIVMRTLMVKSFGDTSGSRTIKHFHYITWPDYGVPESVSPFMTLNRRVMNSWKEDKGPMIVHCSAGVGRTGTFIAVDMALEQAKKEGKVDIAGIVTRLRQQRMKMVQTDIQYIFIHDAVLEEVVIGPTEVPSDSFTLMVKTWRDQCSSKSGKPQIEIQFELLQQSTPHPSDVFKQIAEKYSEKNRTMDYVPSDKWRVALKREYPDYIHATFVHGYSKQKAFIIAQGPMETTIRDFWKMIMDYKASAIVMCCDQWENGQEVCSKYWPSDEPSVVFGEYTISVLAQQSNSKGFLEQKLEITKAKSSESCTVTQFLIHEWCYDGTLISQLTLLQVIESVIKVQQRSGGGPVVVHCSDTVGRSGMFCAVSNAIEQCKTEGLVDVFQATKAVRMNKPGAVATMKQYNTMHDIVMLYLQQYSTYSNFN